MKKWPVTLLFGANGQLGMALRHTLPRIGGVVAITRAECDLTDAEQVRGIIRQVQPTLIVNAAAYTAVDDAETNSDLARVVNGSAPGIIATEGAASGAAMIHYSSDYVFDGAKTSPYCEGDEAHPLSVYGLTKLEGESAVSAANPKHLIFRASWVAGEHGRNFVKTIMRLASTRDELAIVTDQIGTPTTAEFIAAETTRIASVMMTATEGDNRWGLYHLTCGGETSWHAYAKFVVEEARNRGVPLKTPPTKIQGITTEAFAASAKRPPYSVLSTEKVRSVFGTEVPGWRSAVRQLISSLITGARTEQVS